MATITLKTSYFVLAFILRFFPAQYILDGGAPVKCGWGTATIPVPPGNHTLEVFFPYLFLKQAGKGTTQFAAAEGQPISVSYKAPWLVFLPGKLTVS